MNQQILKRLDQAISSTLVTNSDDPDSNIGAAICILERGKIIYRNEYGYADQEKQIPMKPDSIFRCYSMTKPITSVAVMILIERGLLSLCDPASRYLPGFQNQKVYTPDGLVPVEREVTIMDLTNMTAGVCYPDASFPAGDYMEKVQQEYYQEIQEGKVITTYDLANRIGRQPLAFQPGTRWLYSFCADVLGAIVEVVSGKRYSDFLKEEIFLPLEMVDTDFYVPEEKRDRFMQFYQYMPETKTMEPCTWQHLCLSHMHLKKPDFESGGAGLVSTIDDYAKFAEMMMNGGIYKNNRILSRKTIQRMTQNQLTEKQIESIDWTELKGYGYGSLMRQMIHPESAESLGTKGEYGWDGWLGSYLAIDPEEELAIIYVIQKCGGNGPRDIRVIRNIIYSALD